MRTVGVVVNPVAGMGGRVGLKGTDGQRDRARERGADPVAPERARAALDALFATAPDVRVATYGDPMGEREARAAGFDPVVVGAPADPERTVPADTRAAVAALVERGVDLVLFAGGDGTAVDVAGALADRPDVPMLGVPAGVKMFSAVFAVSPRAAGRIAATFDRTERREVSDLDEDAYRAGEVRAALRAVATVPVDDDLQAGKQLAGGDVEGAAAGVADDAEPGVTYVLGPGGTLDAVKRALGFEGSPLGVDVWRDGAVLVRDGSAAEIATVLGDRNVVVVSPVGGQGFLLGRGNAQLSPDVIRRCTLVVVASEAKLATLDALRVDTSDPSIDADLRGWHRVRTGRSRYQLVQVV